MSVYFVYRNQVLANDSSGVNGTGQASLGASNLTVAQGYVRLLRNGAMVGPLPATTVRVDRATPFVGSNDAGDQRLPLRASAGVG